jgi:hypothetical protein
VGTDLLEGKLQLLLVTGGCAVNGLGLATRSTLATDLCRLKLGLQLLELLGVHGGESYANEHDTTPFGAAEAREQPRTHDTRRGKQKIKPKGVLGERKNAWHNKNKTIWMHSTQDRVGRLTDKKRHVINSRRKMAIEHNLSRAVAMAKELLATLSRMGVTGCEALSEEQIGMELEASPSLAQMIAFLSQTLRTDNVVTPEEMSR